jgi:hypothetical protein
MKHKLHKVIILAGCFCFGGLSTGLAYRFDPTNANIEVNDATTARSMVNILLRHYRAHPDDLRRIAAAYTEAFIGCLNEFGGKAVLKWKLPGCQGLIRSYVKDGIKDGRDQQRSWDALHNAFSVVLTEALVAIRFTLDDIVNALDARPVFSFRPAARNIAGRR